jgi:hypothetical protein
MARADWNFRLHARTSAAAYKARMLRFALLSRAARALAPWRSLDDRLLLWPEFELPGDADRLERTLRWSGHYLAGLDVPVEYFQRVEGRLFRCLWRPGGPPAKPEPMAGEGEAARRSRRARHIGAWNADSPPVAISLHPHQYAIADVKNHSEAGEWLRLLSDLHARRRGAPDPRPELTPLPRPRSTCAIVGPGPSISRFARERDRFDACIVVNSAVLDPSVQEATNLFAICALDPDFLAPLESMKPFWVGAFSLLRRTPAVLVTARSFAPFIERNFPEDIRRKCLYARVLGVDTIRWRTRFDLGHLSVTSYGNVLTDLALPVAASISDDVTIYGCDGRDPGKVGENFQKHSALQGYEDASDRESPGKYSGLLDGQVLHFYRMTRVVTDECRRRGVTLRLRQPSHNLGLEHLPVAAVPEP